MKKIKIAVAGSSGRMGRALLEAVLQGADTELGGALEVVDSPSLGKNAGEMIGAMSDVLVSADIDAAITNICRCGSFQEVRAAIHSVAKA